MGDAGGAVLSGRTAGEAKERMGEVLFAVAVFFGLLHFASIACQIGVMVLHTAFAVDAKVPLKSSMMLGHVYIGFLVAYIGRKEYVRWLSKDETQLPRYVWLKLSRGEVIIVGWALLAGAAFLVWQMGYINEVPNTLLYTLGEVVALWGGSDYLKNRILKGNAAARETESNIASYGDRVLDYCREHGSIDRTGCQNGFGLTEDQAYRLLKRLVKDRKLAEYGEKKNRRYRLP